MKKNKSAAAGKARGAGKAGQVSAISENRIRRRRANIKMIQNLLLIWLDKNMDDNNANSHNTVSDLQRVVNSVHTFTNGDECVQFIETINSEKACMIISGSLGEYIVPRVHNMSQVDSIFICCGNKKRHEQWAKDWPKIKGVFTKISSICKALKEVAQQCEQNSIAISFMDTTGDMSTKNLAQLDFSFMYTQIMKEILLSIQFELYQFEEFIDYCRDAFADNNDKLLNVKELQQKYHQKTPIWWYTSESFLYPMLNRALRLMDLDIIIRIGFFIGDLHRHIEQLHADQFNADQFGAIFTVYRGQGMSKTNFEQLTKTKGGLMSFNNFLSTSKDRDVSLTSARSALSNSDLVGVLFVMIVDPTASTTPFASITDVSYLQGQDEVLFSMHTVFRIREVKPMRENHRLFQVHLTLTSDNDRDIHALADRIRGETKISTGWDQLGRLLLKMGQFNKAEEVFNVMLEQTIDDSEIVSIYYYLARVKVNQEEYKEAITYYKKSLEIDLKRLPSNHPDLASSYNNIGNMYAKMDEYSKALSYYEKDLEITQRTLPPNHPDVGVSYHNIGNVYNSMNEYSKALSYYEKALEIRQKSLSPNHPDLDRSYNNIATVYTKIREYSKALMYYEKGLEIRQKILPLNHPDLAASYNNIGLVCAKMGEYSKGLSSHEKALEIRQNRNPPNHPDLAASYNNIGAVYANTGEYSKARSFLERAVDIGQHSLPPDHYHLQTYRNNFENLKKKL